MIKACLQIYRGLFVACDFSPSSRERGILPLLTKHGRRKEFEVGGADVQ